MVKRSSSRKPLETSLRTKKVARLHTLACRFLSSSQFRGRKAHACIHCNTAAAIRPIRVVASPVQCRESQEKVASKARVRQQHRSSSGKMIPNLRLLPHCHASTIQWVIVGFPSAYHLHVADTRQLAGTELNLARTKIEGSHRPVTLGSRSIHGGCSSMTLGLEYNRVHHISPLLRVSH
jgi:hypothetical protein